ncbi:PREDICTED: uncharacterized protein LOC104821225 [Tarenaya hassleriana]|uniref:uncharacterized protein LOC104821225 n=1 Tax=Tarenaya hassleriana TaxID=28532 RepID=UPI00053C7A4D|nr:PREDICTED: uncharacterized protein LOC104821225 [Tarenaya hassleriana]
MKTSTDDSGVDRPLWKHGDNDYKLVFSTNGSNSEHHDPVFLGIRQSGFMKLYHAIPFYCGRSFKAGFQRVMDSYGRCWRDPPTGMTECIAWIRTDTNDTTRDRPIIVKLLLQAVTYLIWHERNNHILNNESNSLEKMLVVGELVLPNAPNHEKSPLIEAS